MALVSSVCISLYLRSIFVFDFILDEKRRTGWLAFCYQNGGQNHCCCFLALAAAQEIQTPAVSYNPFFSL